MNGSLVEYIKYDASYEEKALSVFTEAFKNYPLFYNVFEDNFETEEKLLDFYIR